MEKGVLLQESELMNVVDKLVNVADVLTKQKKSEKEFLGNEEFMKLLGISKRTAQTWRDEGIIAFSQVGSKIYYSMADIAKLMQEYRRDDFGNEKSVRNKITSK